MWHSGYPVKAKFRDGLRDVIQKLQNIPTRPVAVGVADELVNTIKGNIKREVDPYGKPFVEHSKNYIRRIGGASLPKPYKKLLWTGALLNSFESEVLYTQKGKTVASARSNDPKLPYHQEGRGNNPVRAVYPKQGNIPNNWTKQAERIALTYINKTIRSY